MQQPPKPSSVPKTPEQHPKASTSTQKRKPPTPQELITHYTDQGLDSQAASVKVIEDLQNVLYRVVSSNNAKNKKDKLMLETSRKMDSLNHRLAILDMKVDSKPGYGGAFAIGLASGAALTGINSVLPHVLEGLGQIWGAVKTATSARPSSSG